MNYGLVFIKPHAATKKTVSLLEEFLKKSNIGIESKGTLSGKEIENLGIIDSHYFSISNTAMHISAKDLSLSDDVMTEFDSKYGISWLEGISSGTIKNSAEFMTQFGINSGEELTKVWTDGDFMKLGPGLYVCKTNDERGFLINGFYPGMREKFIKPNATVYWYTVQFDENTVPWKKFRGEIIGATDPSKAVDGSIRNILYNNYSQYDLTFQPSMSDNGIHASAGPIEGMRERMVWAGIDPNTSNLGQTLFSKGISKEKFASLLENGEAKFFNEKGPIFDITEDIDTSKVIEGLNF